MKVKIAFELSSYNASVSLDNYVLIYSLSIATCYPSSQSQNMGSSALVQDLFDVDGDMAIFGGVLSHSDAIEYDGCSMSPSRLPAEISHGISRAESANHE
ncbi:hypothetical protein Dimus_014069 [Dionaea muscipula]